jgi:hypothetical protein
MISGQSIYQLYELIGPAGLAWVFFGLIGRGSYFKELDLFVSTGQGL